MKLLPPPEIYKKELDFIPYRVLLKRVETLVCEDAPKSGSVLDLMCGPGYLLRKIDAARPDLSLYGLDVDRRFIEYARAQSPHIGFDLADVLTHDYKRKFDVVMCTGALHHIPYENQERVIVKMKNLIASGGFGILADVYIEDYSNENERRFAAAQLGYEYLLETMRNGAPLDIISSTIDIMHNDVMGDEFKTSIHKRMPLLREHFGLFNISTTQTWPAEGYLYGEYIHILRT